MTNLCAECKGKCLCGRPRCPIVSRFHASLQVRPSDSYMGGAPSVFIGSHGYPQVKGGPLLIDESDTPPEWIRRGYTIDDIVNVRARTIRGTSPALQITDPLQEIALSSSPLDVEVAFTRPVAFDLTFDGILAPVGLNGDIRRLEVLDNARVERPVDRITSDTDLHAAEGIELLYRDGVDVYHINQLFSAGLLGVKRRMVPTRWSITAVDDMLSERLKQRVSRYSPLEQIEVFASSLHANRIACLLIPGSWQYEMVEIWERQSLWAGDTDTILRDGEGRNRKNTYSPLAGAYYSARLAALEHLDRVQRCARVLVVRRITRDYWAPLGTWVVREAVRAAMAKTPHRCETVPAATECVTQFLGTGKWFTNSSLIQEIQAQKTLFEF
jgi:hypothetical protein